MTKSYQVTLAQLAWIKGTLLTIEAQSWEEAFAKAKASQGDGANWPVDEDGDEVRGFGDIEIDRAYCEDEPETDHDGEEASAPSAVYAAAPLMADALKLVMRCARGELERPLTERQPWREAEAAMHKAFAAAGLEV